MSVVVTNKLEERNYYTIEREGVSRRATAEQLRTYHTSESGPREVPGQDEIGDMTSDHVVGDGEVDCLPLTTYSPGNGDNNDYENFRSFSSDEEGLELETGPEKRSRKAPERFPVGQWVRAVHVNMCLTVTSNDVLTRQPLNLRSGNTQLTSGAHSTAHAHTFPKVIFIGTRNPSIPSVKS